MFTKQHYEFLANFLATNDIDRNIVIKLANQLKADNPKFDGTMFLLKSASPRGRATPSKNPGWANYDGLD